MDLRFLETQKEPDKQRAGEVSVACATLFPLQDGCGAVFYFDLLCVSCFICTVTLQSAPKVGFIIPTSFMRAPRLESTHHFLVVTPSGRVESGLNCSCGTQSLCFPFQCTIREGRFSKSGLGKIERVGKQKKPKCLKIEFYTFETKNVKYSFCRHITQITSQKTTMASIGCLSSQSAPSTHEELGGCREGPLGADTRPWRRASP